MEEKIRLIDEIVKRHPSYGVGKGYSHYTGGMSDSGNWYFRKMLDVPIDDLKLFLDEIISDENKPIEYSFKSIEDLHSMSFYEAMMSIINNK